MKEQIEQLLSAQAEAWVLSKTLKSMESNTQLEADSKQDISECLRQINGVVENLSRVQKEIESRLPEYVFDAGAHWAASVLKMPVILMFPTHLERMLSHQNEGVRQVAVRCGDLTEEQLQIALQDPEKWVRDAAVLRQQNGNLPLINRDQETNLGDIVRIQYCG